MTPIEDTMIHAAIRFLNHHSTAAAAVLTLPDGKVVAVGTEAELRTMLAGKSDPIEPFDTDEWEHTINDWMNKHEVGIRYTAYRELVDIGNKFAAQFVQPAVANNIQQKVIEWAKARQIIPNARAATQLMKTGSELGELFDAEIKGDIPGIVDGIGDVLVTLIIYAELNGLTINDCLASAYNEIKDRTGTLLPSGVFVKD